MIKPNERWILNFLLLPSFIYLFFSRVVIVFSLLQSVSHLLLVVVVAVVGSESERETESRNNHRIMGGFEFHPIYWYRHFGSFSFLKIYLSVEHCVPSCDKVIFDTRAYADWHRCSWKRKISHSLFLSFSSLLRLLPFILRQDSRKRFGIAHKSHLNGP